MKGFFFFCYSSYRVCSILTKFCSDDLQTTLHITDHLDFWFSKLAHVIDHEDLQYRDNVLEYWNFVFVSLSNWSETVPVEFGDSATYWYKNPTKTYQIPIIFFFNGTDTDLFKMLFLCCCVYLFLLDFVWLKIWAGKEGCWFDHDKCASCPQYILWVLLNVMCILPFQCLSKFLLLALILSKQ